MTSETIRAARIIPMIFPRRLFLGNAAADDDVVIKILCRSLLNCRANSVAHFFHVAINSDRQQGNSVQINFPDLRCVSTMKISIVVPAFNEEKLIGKSLARINLAAAAFHRTGWQTEMIVCDNNSTDQTAEIARANGAKVVFEPINQIARARNCGAAAATGEWLVFVDADSQPSTELFADVASEIKKGKAIAGGSTLRLDHPDLGARVVTEFWNRISRVTHWAAGAFIFCETTAFRAIGGFSNELFTGEELDLFKKLKRLARKEKRQVVILSRHPLLTSGRKVQLYRRRELGRFFLKALFRPMATMKNRDACSPWYDGRR